MRTLKPTGLFFLIVQDKLRDRVASAKRERKTRDRQLHIVCTMQDTDQSTKRRYRKTNGCDEMQAFLLGQQSLCFLCGSLYGREILVAFIVIVQQIVGCNMKQLTDLQQVLCVRPKRIDPKSYGIRNAGSGHHSSGRYGEKGFSYCYDGYGRTV